MSHEPSPPAEEPEATRPAAAFSVQEEGGATGLYLSQWTLEALAAVLAVPDDALAVVLHGGTQTPLPWALARRLQGDLELVLFSAGAPAPPQALPQPILAAPAVALQPGAHLAVSVQATGELAVFSRDPALLVRALRGFLQAVVKVQTAGERAEPALAPALVRPLLCAQAPGVSTRITVRRSERYWTLVLETTGDGVDRSACQWVCEGPCGRWRAGWSW